MVRPLRARDDARARAGRRRAIQNRLCDQVRERYVPDAHRPLPLVYAMIRRMVHEGHCDRRGCSDSIAAIVTDLLYPDRWRPEWGARPEFAVDGQPQRRLPLDDGVLLPTPDRGIVTGATAIHWPCLGALAIGAARNRIGLAVADHGLEDWQRCELDRIGVRWIDHERPGLAHADVRPDTIAALNAWWKPWVGLASPFRESLWLDSDAVVTGDLTPGFDLLGKGPWVSTQHRFFGVGEALYRSMVDYLFSGDEQLLRSFSVVNTGVLAWAAGEPTIADWAAASQDLLADMEALKRCTVRDQSAYVAMLSRRARGQRPLPTLLHDDRWNWPADGLASTQIAERLPVSEVPEELLEQATKRNPGAVVVHWLGRPKPWQLARCQQHRRATARSGA